jgi:prepilin-type N-terminal cleavage/methylation domain-containing protein
VVVGANRRGVGQGGFTLIELMVVIIIIAIIAVLAIPTMNIARSDRRAYQDAGLIMQLFRAARTRAVARGGAELIAMTANGTADRGTFVLWEAVAQNAGGQGLNRTPISSCKAPTTWVLVDPSSLLVDRVDLNGTAGQLEVDADIETQMFVYGDPTTSAAASFTAGYICYTPLGHSYLNLGGGTTPLFDGQLPTISPLVMRVTRQGGGTMRDVVVPPNGMARLFSHT